LWYIILIELQEKEHTMETYIFEFLFVVFQLGLIAGIVAIARHGKKRLPIPSYPGSEGVRFEHTNGRDLHDYSNQFQTNPIYSSMAGNYYNGSLMDVSRSEPINPLFDPCNVGMAGNIYNDNHM
jgi:hypothetical protein